MGKGKAILRNSKTQRLILSEAKKPIKNSYRLSKRMKLSQSECYRQLNNLVEQGFLIKKEYGFLRNEDKIQKVVMEAIFDFNSKHEQQIKSYEICLQEVNK